MKFKLLIKTKNAVIKIKIFLALKCSDVVFVMLINVKMPMINVKMPTIVGILTFMSSIKFMPS